MSRRSPKAEPEGSLDLLLDTICNTFGGVVFISILVVILVNMTNESAPFTPPSEASQSKLVALEIEREHTHEQLRRLRAVAAQRTETDRALSSAESRRLAEELQRQNDMRSRQIQTKSDTVGAISGAQIQTNRAAKRMHERKTQIQRGETRLAGLLQSLRKQVAIHSRKVGLPQLRQTHKTSIGFFLHNNRLFAVHRPGRHDSKFENPKLNTADIQKIDQDGKTYLEPRPGAGIVVQPANATNEAIKRKIPEFSSKNYYAKVFVWQDSFKAFAELRKILVDAGFEYALIPMPKDGKVVVGSSSRDEVQ